MRWRWLAVEDSDGKGRKIQHLETRTARPAGDLIPGAPSSENLPAPVSGAQTTAPADTHVNPSSSRPNTIAHRPRGPSFVGLILLACVVAIAWSVWQVLFRYKAHGMIVGTVVEVAASREGLVSGSSLVRSPFENVLTRLQAFEYLQGIFVGRLLTAPALEPRRDSLQVPQAHRHGHAVEAQPDTWKVMTANFLAYMGFHVIQVVTILYYSTNKPRDALVCAIVPLVTFYNLFRRFARLVAVTGEVFLRRSYKDSFYPRHVQAATWHW